MIRDDHRRAGDEPRSPIGSLKALDTLADDLANNYLDTSLSLEDTSKNGLRRQVFAHETLRRGEDFAHQPWTPSRNVLVLGSGASAAAFGPERFPLVSTAIEHVTELLTRGGANRSWVEARLQEESERVVSFYGFHDARKDFETQLAILSEIFSPNNVAEALASLYELRYAPHIVFELIAHMLRHRFLDAVINFNFDELLDVAVSEEIGESHYNRVLSDGDARPLDEIMVRNRLKIPLYIKPHGTVGHRSTMRFTKDQYFRLPRAMYEFMRDIVGGHHRESGARRPGYGYRPYRTNLISVGFGMASLDLIRMIRQEIEENPKRADEFAIFHLNTRDWARRRIAQIERETGVEQQYLVAVEDFGGLEETVRTLWEMVRTRFSPLYQPRGIARHELVHQLFHGRSSDQPHGRRIPEADDTYLLARLCAEVVLALAKGNGRVDLSHAVNDRIGIYFNLLSRSHPQLARSMKQVVDALGDREFVEWTGSAKHVLTVREAGTWKDPEAARKQLAELLWRRLSRCLISLGDRELEGRIRQFEGKEEEEGHPVHYLRALVDSDAQDIRPRFEHNHFLLFRQPDTDQVLHTNLSVTLHFAKMLREPNWDLMLAISENGKVLEKVERHFADDRELEKKAFSVIVAETDHQQVTDTRLDSVQERLKLLNDRGRGYFTLPVTEHNHHMVLLLKREPDPGLRTWTPVGAIYYEKVGLGNRVSPVLLDNSQTEDLDILVTTFFYYVQKSRYGARMNVGNHDGRAAAPAPGDPAAENGEGGADGPRRPPRGREEPESKLRLETAEALRADLLGRWWDSTRPPQSPAAGA
jgi:hypothetical protein